MLMRVPASVTILLFLNVSLAFSSASPQPEGSASRSSLKEMLRIKRQACADGTYPHEGKNCCLCAAGQKVKTHCTTNQQYGECEHCEPGTYNNVSNFLETCQPCTSCSQINANLEEESPCTVARDRKCRCKSGFFCDKDGGMCKICHPCKTCDHGVSKECTETSDTECNEKSGGSVGIIIGSIFAFLVAAGALVGLYVFFKRRMRRQPDPPRIDDPEPPVDLPLIKGEKLEPLLPDIAEELDWTVMRDVAQRSGMKKTRIDSCEQDYPHSTQEQTYQLLVKYVNERGKTASKDLLQALERSGNRRKAETIREILTRGNQDGQNPSA